MLMKKFAIQVIASGVVLISWMTPASSDTFQPMQFLQDASVVTAIATAVSQLHECEQALVFSQEKQKGKGQDILAVVVTCNKFPKIGGQSMRATVRVQFRLNQDGSVGAPIGFSYD